MGSVRPMTRRFMSTIAAVVVALGVLATAVPVAAGRPVGAEVDVRFRRFDGFDSPGTPAKYNKVGAIQVGPSDADNVLVLVPGTSASAAYFVPLAKDIVKMSKGWQVWAVERRENMLEDHSVLNQAKKGKAAPKQIFDYYLGFVTDPSITKHFQFIPDADVAFAREWGMRVAVEDMRRVINAAKKEGGKVVLGGHSLGGTITTAYATWDFSGQPGAKDLSGLVYIDGGSNPDPAAADETTMRLQALQSGSPWLTFGGIPAPYAGLFNAAGSTGVKIAPDEPSLGYSWPALPANLKPPVQPTNEGQYGYALDVKTSPPGLRAAQAHLGQLAAGGDPRGWDGTGALTPLQRYADMFSGTGLPSLDGTAWYHPQRLTIDSGGVAAGNPNPTQQILDVRATHGRDLPRRLLVYAFGAALGGQRVLDGATVLAEQSGIPDGQLTLVNGEANYAHNDPAGASPNNEFRDNLVPFLRRVAKARSDR
jgi:pimeloyl-ACP methyl ester carboxylesterase